MKNSIKEVKCFKKWIENKAHDVAIRYNITQYREEIIILFCAQADLSIFFNLSMFCATNFALKLRQRQTLPFEGFF